MQNIPAEEPSRAIPHHLEKCIDKKKENPLVSNSHSFLLLGYDLQGNTLGTAVRCPIDAPALEGDKEKSYSHSLHSPTCRKRISVPVVVASSSPTTSSSRTANTLK